MNFEPWLTPGGLAIVAAGVLWLVRSTVNLDRRLGEAEKLAPRLLGDGKGDPGLLARFQTRDDCGVRHGDVASRASLAEAFEQMREMQREQAEDRASLRVALERFTSAVERFDRLEERLARLLEDTNPRFKR